MHRYDVRDQLLIHLRADTLGPKIDADLNPINDEELYIAGSPDRYYLVGKLLPVRDSTEKQSNTSEELLRENTHEADLTESKEDSETKGVSSDSGAFTEPSSMGLTVCPEYGTEAIDVDLEWAMYEKRGDCWKRVPHSERVTINFGDLDFGEKRGPIRIGTQLSMYIRKGTESHPTLTVRIKNELVQEARQSRAKFTIFQPVIKFKATEFNWMDVRKSQDEIRQDKTMMILYSDSDILALGHNVGVNWNDEGEIWTDFLPEFTMNKMEEDRALRNLVPSMKTLCDEAQFADAIAKFKQFIDTYGGWIGQSEEILEHRIANHQMPENLQSHADSLVSKARQNMQRMIDGLEFLECNADARKAFILSNRAIHKSQTEPSHPDLAGRKGFEWRPFQIAFQLLNIKGLCALTEDDPGFNERDMIDLAWFPTGGGKTEAYLGMIATIGFYRRIRFPEKEVEKPSVHAIMRYTLRLLTSDQADRLVRLVGAMNAVARVDNPQHEFKEFRVGMWIGSDASPNKLLRTEFGESAENNLDLLANDLPEEKGTVIQFEMCPWCGSEEIRNHENWSIQKLNDLDSLHGCCPEEDCLFHEWIPFTCVDDDIYMNPPSILLATADKFAQLARNPWAKSIDPSPRSEVARKYNCRNLLGFIGDVRPPDLIIQDELHLLTGPLGTIAGLVETALEVSWENINHKPKYVAATATIRGAERDAMLMYGRTMNVFPPPVATASDNFFAQLSDDENAGRKHVAIMGPPGAARTMFAQPTASFLQRFKQLREENNTVADEIFDPYFTVVGYFNSLRELGGAQNLLPDRVAREFISRRFAPLGGVDAREVASIKELTSRKSSQDLKNIKASLTRSIDHDPVDVVCTTNMFQVGIDIGRLGAMIIVGQPKSNSEYIQSSGRVGRQHPGVVISLLRSTYPRDQSHYENFREFHQEVYAHVDLTSTTPFSQRSLDRGMASAIAIMLRLSEDSFSQNFDLQTIWQSQQRRAQALRLVELFKRKLESRESHEYVESATEIVQEALNCVSRKFTQLMTFLRMCNDQGLRPMWEERRGENRREELGWLRNSSGHVEAADSALQSFRDVAPEVRVVEGWRLGHPGFENHVFTMPAGHLLAQAAPGNIWEKDGKSYLTHGIQFWSQGEGNLALRPISQGGQVVERDAIYELLPENTKLRYLPTNEAHGAVSIQRFPEKYGFRCGNGHLSSYLRPSEDGNFYCTRNDCGEKASPTRWVSVCHDGHLHAFDYWGWVHNSSAKAANCDRDQHIDLIYGNDAAHTLKDWNVKCQGCGVERDMSRIQQITAEDGAPCGGHKPWLSRDTSDNCELKLIPRSVSATNITFNNGGTILLIPLQVSWRHAQFLNSRGMMAMATDTRRAIFEELCGENREEILIQLRDTPFVDGDNINNDSLFDTCKEYNEHHNTGRGDPLTIGNIRKRERHGLVNPEQASELDPNEFYARKIVDRTSGGFWSSDESPCEFITRVDRLTELRYISGITRLDPSGNEFPIDLREGDKHGIARLHHGEGIYFDISPSWVEAIRSSRLSELEQHHANMRHSHERIRHNVLNQLPSLEEHEIASNDLTILHTFSHLLIREICMISGYSSGSITERLYLTHQADGGINNCGILLYTSGPSSDGTLGGLVRQATSERLELILRRALLAKEDCSNDPVCYDHTPSGDERNGAACHACLYLSETSCELGNLFLDRRWE